MNDYWVVDGSRKFVACTGRTWFFELYFKIGEVVEMVPEFQGSTQVDLDFSRGFAGIGYDQFC